ncbi:hypothetical protein Y032_0019g3781 [Ancylostoma ceylanicum]|uniref:Uncharacterized protein n=1 Tax=Ancylostoma ceylanicum TaxID=53326 RepID=A0A016V2W4_9BILA|nr:hypothetical protein Y032_0019g3781 [Ancylostoma ceylanicum]
MKWFAIALCIALFCVGLIESAPSSSSSEEAMKFRRRLKREIEEVTNRVDKMGRFPRSYMEPFKHGRKKKGKKGKGHRG